MRPPDPGDDPGRDRAHSVGPHFTGTLSYFSGCHGVSKRGIEEIAENVFGASIALGTVANLEREVSAALEPSHREALEAVRQAGVKYADETSWKLWGKLCWLWAAATTGVAAFVIHAKRSALGLQAILGESIEGIVHSDRWHVYLQVPEDRRQLCWADLKRDFRKIVECGGPSAFVGRRGLRIVGDLFAAWHAFEAGTITRGRLQELITPLERRFGKALVDGGLGDDAHVAKFCENLLNLEAALWTFARVEGVEPTNNFMERLVRLAVLCAAGASAATARRVVASWNASSRSCKPAGSGNATSWNISPAPSKNIAPAANTRIFSLRRERLREIQLALAQKGAVCYGETI